MRASNLVTLSVAAWFALCAHGCIASEAPDADAGAALDGAGSETPGLALTRHGPNVILGEAYTACGPMDRCSLVDRSCQGCCEPAAIRASLSTYYEENALAACRDLRGDACGCVSGGCNCNLSGWVARCEAGRCRAIERSALPCFSPTQHVDLAYVQGARGCPCDKPNQSICTAGAALICFEVRPGFEAIGQRWIAVEDGPCGEDVGDPTCAEGERRASAAACLDAFDSCYGLASGEYCGMHR